MLRGTVRATCPMSMQWLLPMPGSRLRVRAQISAATNAHRSAQTREEPRYVAAAPVTKHGAAAAARTSTSARQALRAATPTRRAATRSARTPAPAGQAFVATARAAIDSTRALLCLAATAASAVRVSTPSPATAPMGSAVNAARPSSQTSVAMDESIRRRTAIRAARATPSGAVMDRASDATSTCTAAILERRRVPGSKPAAPSERRAAIAARPRMTAPRRTERVCNVGKGCAWLAARAARTAGRAPSAAS